LAGDPDAPASRVIVDIARQLVAARSSLVGKALPLKF
jgi:hypothetical protein